MRILVFGAGAIGSLLGHRLSRAAHQVTLIGRSSYVRAVREHGLILQPRHGEAQSRAWHSETGDVTWPKAFDGLLDIPAAQRSWDLVLLTAKVYDTAEAAQTLAAHLPPNATVLIVQNGVGGEEIARRAFPEAAIVSAVITLSVSVWSPGRISLETHRGGLNLAPMQPGQDVRKWAALFASAGLRTGLCDDYRAQKWSKALLNLLANAIPAILDMTPAEVFADARLFAAERAAFLEALRVMTALGLRPVPLLGYPVPFLVRAMRVLPPILVRPLLRRLVASGRGEKKPSLHMDLAHKRKRSEVLYLNGAVATQAGELGLPAPVNQTLVETFMDVASGRVPWARFQGQPRELIAAIRAVKGGGEQ